MTLADKLTVSRIILIPFFISLLFYFNFDRLYLRFVVTAIFTFAVLTDFFDGLVARIKKEKSELGQIIDPLADKLLLLTAFVSLYALRGSLPLKFQVPLVVVLVVVSRDLIILLGLMVLRFLKIEVTISPSVWGKLTTFSQMFTILCVLMDAPFSRLIWSLAVLFTVISGIEYFSRGVRAINVRVNSPSA